MAGIADPGEEDGKEDLCMQCGLCCRVFGVGISPSHENLYSWIVDRRLDILRHFSACMSDGTWIPCADLDALEIGGIVRVEIRDPETGGYPAVCPFLRRIGKSRYACAIHAEKPEMCKNYMPWVFGETYFPRCRALEKRESESAWSRIR